MSSGSGEQAVVRREAVDDETPSGATLSGFAAGLAEGQPFAGYVLQDCLASDDVSAVFKAQDKNMDRTVVVKALLPSPERRDAVEEFFSQAGSVARVRHAGIARGLDAGRGGGAFFMAHEPVRGESLDARMKRRQTGRLTEREALVLVGEIATVLQGLFDSGQTHGDLRPTRVMLLEGGGVRLAGLGFAWTLSWPNDPLAFAAKPDFIPPEKIMEELNVDVRGDLYSLGCLWWNALLAEPVFAGTTPAQTLDMHMRATPRTPRDIDPRLSAATSQLILWLLEKDRDARPRTPREFLRKLSSHPLLQAERSESAEKGIINTEDSE